MHSGITKMYYRKTVGHVFTKPVQIEGTTQNFFFHHSSHFCRQAMRVYVVRKWPLRGEKSSCVLEYQTSKSVVTVQRAFRAKCAQVPPTDKTARAWYKQFTETGCPCKQKSCGRPLTADDDVERFGPVSCTVRINQRELQLMSYRCRKQQCGGFCVTAFLLLR